MRSDRSHPLLLLLWYYLITKKLFHFKISRTPCNLRLRFPAARSAIEPSSRRLQRKRRPRRQPIPWNSFTTPCLRHCQGAISSRQLCPYFDCPCGAAWRSSGLHTPPLATRARFALPPLWLSSFSPPPYNRPKLCSMGTLSHSCHGAPRPPLLITLSRRMACPKLTLLAGFSNQNPAIRSSLSAATCSICSKFVKRIVSSAFCSLFNRSFLQVRRLHCAEGLSSQRCCHARRVSEKVQQCRATHLFDCVKQRVAILDSIERLTPVFRYQAFSTFGAISYCNSPDFNGVDGILGFGLPVAAFTRAPVDPADPFGGQRRSDLLRIFCVVHLARRLLLVLHKSHELTAPLCTSFPNLIMFSAAKRSKAFCLCPCFFPSLASTLATTP